MTDYYQLQEDVLSGRAGGRILWQPRIGCWYDDKKYIGQELPGVFRGRDLPQVYRELDCSNRIYEYNASFRLVEDETVKRSAKQLSRYVTEERIETPVGNLTRIMRGNASNGGVYPEKWWVSSEEELEIMTYVVERQDWEWDEEYYQSVLRKWGRIGAPVMFMPRVNIQYLYIDLMGVEETVYALADYPETVERFFEALERSQERLIRVINQSPIQMINFGDNLHCGFLPDEYFEKYVLPAYQRRCRLLHEGGKFVTSHWDGDTRSLLKYAKRTGLDGIEAITPKPQGDVTLKEVKEALGDEVWLVDGIAAILFNEEYPEEALMDQIKECIELFAPKLILGISDELSSTGEIERVRRIREYVDEYNRKITEGGKTY